MNAAQYAKGLREFADWVEENPGMLDSFELQRELTVLKCAVDADRFADLYATLGTDLPVEVGPQWAEVHRRFGPIDVQVYTDRENVCRPVTSTVETTEWVYDPPVAGEREPSDEQLANGHGVEGGIGYDTAGDVRGEHDWRL